MLVLSSRSWRLKLHAKQPNGWPTRVIVTWFKWIQSPIYPQQRLNQTTTIDMETHELESAVRSQIAV